MNQTYIKCVGDESRIVQELLFSYGISWASGDMRPLYLHFKITYLHIIGNCIYYHTPDLGEVIIIETADEFIASFTAEKQTQRLQVLKSIVI